MRQLIAGNWKMYGVGGSLVMFDAMATALAASPPACDVLVCPPATLIAQMASKAKRRVALGAQDCHTEVQGAFTGDISAEMLRDAGASAVIVGHSERRQYHGESDALVAAKARAAWRAGLLAIVCIGETEAERDSGSAHGVCAAQLAGSVPDGARGGSTVIAYEPVWAIGTGKTPTASDIAAMHAHIRSCLVERFGAEGGEMRILYGGSVKPSNAAEILALPEVGGALVGGASLKGSDFRSIWLAARPG